MSFDDERLMAEQALAAADLDEAAEVPFPPVARRICQAREALGMTQDDVAARWGEQPSMYWDLELHDDEAFNAVSVERLSDLAAVLKTSIMVLLFGEDPSPSLPLTTYPEVVSRLRAKMGEEGISEDQLSERVGWELESILDDPAQLGELPIIGLRWICREVDVDWAATLTNAKAPHAGDTSVP